VYLKKISIVWMNKKNAPPAGVKIIHASATAAKGKRALHVPAIQTQSIPAAEVRKKNVLRAEEKAASRRVNNAAICGKSN